MKRSSIVPSYYREPFNRAAEILDQVLPPMRRGNSLFLPLFEDFERGMREMFKPIGEACDFAVVGDSFPKMEIIEKENCLDIEMAVAGYEKDSISITVDNNVIAISSDGRLTAKSDEKLDIIKVWYSELKQSRFARAITVPGDEYDLEKIKASHENGMLFITVPKKIKEKKKKEKKLREVTID